MRRTFIRSTSARNPCGETQMWNRYANRGGKSNVRAYRAGDDFIEVVFRDRKAYLYRSPPLPAATVAHMKVLAARGVGLNGFIMRTPAVREGFAGPRLVRLDELPFAA